MEGEDTLSFIHATLVGHFEPRTVLVRMKPLVLRPLDMELVERLLEECGPGVAKTVRVEDGYAHCQWAPCYGDVAGFADKLAREAGAVMVDWNHMLVVHPPEAVRAQEEALAAIQTPGATPDHTNL